MKRAEQAEQTRAALIEAARRQFAARGYLNTKVTDIAADAGRAAGSFYTYFSGKEAMLEALLEEVSAASDRYAGSAGHLTDFSDPAAIRFHVRIYRSLVREHGATLEALRQAALVDDHFTARLREFSRGQSDDIRGHLDNVPGLPASPEVSLTVMTSVLDGFAHMWPEMPEDEAVEVITRFVYRALNGKDYE